MELDQAKKEAEHQKEVAQILKKNISCLFKTAQMELQRKDSQIALYRER